MSRAQLAATIGGLCFVAAVWFDIEQPEGPAQFCAAIAGLCFFLVSVLTVQPRHTTVILGSTQGLRPGDTVEAHGRHYRIVKIHGQTVTWRPV